MSSLHLPCFSNLSFHSRNKEKQNRARNTMQKVFNEASSASKNVAKPLRFVYCDEKGKFKMDAEAFATLQLVNGPIGVVSVCGQAHQGKGFVLNQILSSCGGSQVDSSSHQPSSNGIWMWSEPVRRVALDGTDYNLLILDSEIGACDDGLGTYSTEIISLSALLSSMFIYNQRSGSMDNVKWTLVARFLLSIMVGKGTKPQSRRIKALYHVNCHLFFNLRKVNLSHIKRLESMGMGGVEFSPNSFLTLHKFLIAQMGGIDEAAIDRVSVVTEMIKHILIRASGQMNITPALGHFSPTFVWLLRDFCLDLAEGDSKITPRDYLELALMPVLSGGKDTIAKNEIREAILALFRDQECFALVRPLKGENEPQLLDQISLDKLCPEFRSGLDALITFVFERTRPLQIGSTTMSGPVLADLTQSFIDALNNGAVPGISPSWQAFESTMKDYDIELARKLEIKELTVKLDSAKDACQSFEKKARILEQEKTHLEQKYMSDFKRFEEVQERCKLAEKYAKSAIELADKARSRKKYLFLENGRFWFPAQVYNRKHQIGFIMSCYDAEVCYDSLTDTFQARYLPHDPRTEEGIQWDRIRSPPVDTPPHVLHVSDCRNDLYPGDHIEIQWRGSRYCPYGWWYGVIGHLETCQKNENLCFCYHSDKVVVEFIQYSPGSRWRQMTINRKGHQEEGDGIRGFYGGIRKLNCKEEISVWTSLLPKKLLQ